MKRFRTIVVILFLVAAFVVAPVPTAPQVDAGWQGITISVYGTNKAGISASFSGTYFGYCYPSSSGCTISESLPSGWWDVDVYGLPWGCTSGNLGWVYVPAGGSAWRSIKCGWAN